MDNFISSKSHNLGILYIRNINRMFPCSERTVDNGMQVRILSQYVYSLLVCSNTKPNTVLALDKAIGSWTED